MASTLGGRVESVAATPRTAAMAPVSDSGGGSAQGGAWARAGQSSPQGGSQSVSEGDVVGKYVAEMIEKVKVAGSKRELQSLLVHDRNGQYKGATFNSEEGKAAYNEAMKKFL